MAFCRRPHSDMKERTILQGIRTGPSSDIFDRKRARRWLFAGAACAALLGSVPVTGQGDPKVQPAPPAIAVGTQILMLGTAGGPPLRKDRSQPALLITVRGENYLFDCGTGTVRQLARAGVPIVAVRAVFITHHHPDHDLDLAAFMGNAQFMRGWAQKPLRWTIVGPEGTRQMVDAAGRFFDYPFRVFAAERLFSATGPGGKKGTTAFVAKDVMGAGPVYRDSNIRVTAVVNSHYDLLPAADRAHMKSLSYRIETPDGVIVVTGDTGKSEALTKFANGADVLVTEAIDLPAMYKFLELAGTKAGARSKLLAIRKEHMRISHIDLPDIGRMASTAGVRSVLLTHLGPETDTVSPRHLEDRVGATYAGPVYATRDFDTFCMAGLGRPAVRC